MRAFEEQQATGPKEYQVCTIGMHVYDPRLLFQFVAMEIGQPHRCSISVAALDDKTILSPVGGQNVDERPNIADSGRSFVDSPTVVFRWRSEQLRHAHQLILLEGGHVFDRASRRVAQLARKLGLWEASNVALESTEFIHLNGIIPSSLGFLNQLAFLFGKHSFFYGQISDLKIRLLRQFFRFNGFV